MTSIDETLREMEGKIENLKRELQRLNTFEDERLNAAGLTKADIRWPENMPPKLVRALEAATAAAEQAGEDAAARYRAGREIKEPEAASKSAHGKLRLKGV